MYLVGLWRENFTKGAGITQKPEEEKRRLTAVFVAERFLGTNVLLFTEDLE
jgi:hypothetical protein